MRLRLTIRALHCMGSRISVTGRSKDRMACDLRLSRTASTGAPLRGGKQRQPAVGAGSGAFRGDGADAQGRRKKGKRKASRHVAMPSRMGVVTFNPSRSTSGRN
ncbi:hypothetical protein GCM10027084_02680 [Pseudoxanthomonas sangjuensis]